MLATIIMLSLLLSMYAQADAAKPFTFRGITFETTKDEILELEQARADVGWVSPVSIRVDNIDLGVIKAEHLLYLFKDAENPQRLTQINYDLYGNSKEGEALSFYNSITDLYIEKYGEPMYTEKELSRPFFNALEGLTVAIPTQEENVKNSIPHFSEWLFDSDGYWVSVVAYHKYYPKYQFHEVKVTYISVPYSVTDALDDKYNQVIDSI